MERRDVLIQLIHTIDPEEKIDSNLSNSDLQNQYKKMAQKVLSQQKHTLDLQGETFIPPYVFFIKNKNGNFDTFSIKDIDILLNLKENPYTNKPFSSEGLENLEHIQKAFESRSQWGGFVDTLAKLEGEHDSEYVASLLQKLEKIEQSSNIDEIREIIRTFTREDIEYINSPLFDALDIFAFPMNNPDVQVQNPNELEDFLAKNSVDILQFLISKGYKLDRKKLAYLLIKSAENGNLEIIKFLEKTEKTVDWHYHWADACKASARTGKIDTFMYLYEKFQPDKYSEYNIFYIAVRTGNWQILEKVINDINLDEKTIIYAVADSIRASQIEMMDYFLSKLKLDEKILNRILNSLSGLTIQSKKGLQHFMQYL